MPPAALPSYPGLKTRTSKYTAKSQEDTIKEMAGYICEQGSRPEMQQFASLVLDKCFKRSDEPSLLQSAQCILTYVHNNVHFRPDPPGTELVKSPAITLCIPGAIACIPIGDCDDTVAATLALMRAAGLDVKILRMVSIDHRLPKDEQRVHHVAGVVRDERGKYHPFDPSNKGSRIGYEQNNVEREEIDVLDPKWNGGRGAELKMVGSVVKYVPVTVAPVVRSSRQFGTPTRAVGYGVVTPGDILAYRAMWDTYVLDSIRVSSHCADVYNAAAANTTDPTTKATITQLAADIQTESDNVYKAWNYFATWDKATIVLQGATILTSFQNTVRDAGDLRAQATADKCQMIYPDPATPGGYLQAVPGPDPSAQAQVIAQIEGLGILAAGLLQVFIQSTAYGLEEAGSAGNWLANEAKQTVESVSWLTSPWTWGIALAAVVGVTTIVVVKADSVARLVGAAR